MNPRVKNQILKIAKSGGVVFVGVGNNMRCDDGAGPYVISQLKRKPDPCPLSLGAFIDAGQMPENYIGKIAELKPRTVVVIDVLDFKASAGEVKILEAGELRQASFSTHGMSLSLFAEQVERISGAKVLIVGIQPQSTVLKEGLTDVVKARADELIELIMKFLWCRKVPVKIAP